MKVKLYRANRKDRNVKKERDAGDRLFLVIGLFQCRLYGVTIHPL
jgi:hypothetical protein